MTLSLISTWKVARFHLTLPSPCFRYMAASWGHSRFAMPGFNLSGVTAFPSHMSNLWEMVLISILPFFWVVLLDISGEPLNLLPVMPSLPVVAVQYKLKTQISTACEYPEMVFSISNTFKLKLSSKACGKHIHIYTTNIYVYVLYMCTHTCICQYIFYFIPLICLMWNLFLDHQEEPGRAEGNFFHPCISCTSHTDFYAQSPTSWKFSITTWTANKVINDFTHWYNSICLCALIFYSHSIIYCKFFFCFFKRNIFSSLQWSFLFHYFWIILSFQNSLIPVIVVQSLRVYDSLQPHGLQYIGFPVLHYLPEFAQNHVNWVRDAIRPADPLSALSPSALNLS